MLMKCWSKDVCVCDKPILQHPVAQKKYKNCGIHFVFLNRVKITIMDYLLIP